MASAGLNDTAASWAVSADSVTVYAHKHASSIATYLWSSMNGWTIAVTVLAMLVAYDQIMYQWNKGNLPGPTFKIPFIGPFLESVNPKFELYEAKWATGPLSCVSVFHKFVVIASTRDMTRKIFTSSQYVSPCLVDVAKKLLRPTNFVFLTGKAHVDYRKGLNTLFTRRALEVYLTGQEDMYDTYFEKFVQVSQEEQGGKPIPFMPWFREINCAISCRTFVGHYLSDEGVKKIADDYYHITSALELVNFPIIIPYTRTWYGKRAADMVLESFAACAAKSKVRMAAGGEITCSMDAWIKNMFESERYREAIAAGREVPEEEKPSHVLPRMFSDFEIAQTIFTFLFASQDATSSATTWLFQILAHRPAMLDRVREENLRIRGGDRNRRLDMDMLESLTYTRAVVKEALRYRPPVTMVPYEAKKPFPISDTYTVPKGSMVIPTIHTALQDPEFYPEPNEYNPERWISGDAEKATKNWLVFGAGPHYCIGQTYATNNLIALIGKASMFLDWTHYPTPLSEDIKVFATIFPQNGNASIGPEQKQARSKFMDAWDGLPLWARLITPPPPTMARVPTFDALIHDRVHPTPTMIKTIADTPSTEKILIDVREPSEYQAGFIPSAINIPIASQPDALFLPEEEFEDRFGFQKPPPSKEVVFYCKAGVRSSAAAVMAKQSGYEKVGEYRGSWLDWEKQGGVSR
ncbi:MAG: RNA polymerase C-22 sterol desaturase [Thelocarpon superellum]|nr:MAG: RNA polymerase C-22 sterol desaturase [Thelocarpon superellum]